jgi:hypothetical protein
MKIQKIAIAVTVINLAMLLFASTHALTATPTATPLRVQALELVDANNKVRAQLNVEPGGEVVFRLRDPQGAVRVKLGAGADGSGLVLMDETTEPAIHLLARRTATAEKPNTTRISINTANGQQRVIAP